MSSKHHPNIQELIKVANRIEFDIRVIQEIRADFVEVEVSTKLGTFRCVVCDEYKDLEKNKYAALQVLILDALDLSDGEGDLIELQKSHADLIKGLVDFWLYFCSETSCEGVSPMEWQLNTGEAKALREDY
jgi:hypothetical protein